MKKAIFFAVFVASTGILFPPAPASQKKADLNMQMGFNKTANGLKRDLANAD